MQQTYTVFARNILRFARYRMTAYLPFHFARFLQSREFRARTPILMF